MGLGSFISKQFIDIIQWTDDDDQTLGFRFPIADQEIQYGAQLVVRETQTAVFINEGKIADVFGPGTFKLTTQTLPVLTYLKNWDKLFESPFKSDVHFFSTRLFIGSRWGTPQPITIRDKDFGMVRLRAFGMYSYRIKDVTKFFTQVAGARERCLRDDVEAQLRNLVVSALSTQIGSSSIPFLDMAANQALMGQQVKAAVAASFDNYGLELDSFTVENVSLPEELQKALDTRISMGMAGDLKQFTQYQTAQSIPLAAQNEGGLAGLGAGLASGLAMGQAMTQALTAASMPSIPSMAPTAAAQAPADDPEVRLSKLQGLLQKGLISQTDYDTAKAEILKRLMG
jgi:membrane protease subunit (stomatin/prohibitin family)